MSFIDEILAQGKDSNTTLRDSEGESIDTDVDMTSTEDLSSTEDAQLAQEKLYDHFDSDYDVSDILLEYSDDLPQDDSTKQEVEH